MKKYYILTFIILVTFEIGYSQSIDTISVLHHKLATSKDDTSKVLAQLAICYEYRLGNSDSSLYYGKKALTLSKKIKFPKGEILALGFLAITSHQVGNLPQALEMGFESLRVAEANNNLAYLTGAALNAVGEAYTILKDYPKALHYLRLQKANAERRQNSEGMAYSAFNIGLAYYEMNQLDSAFYYEQIAIKHFRGMGREEPLVYRILGDIQIKRNNPVEALVNYRESLEISLKNNERRALSAAYNKIASFYKNIQLTDSAIYYAKKGLEVSESISQKKNLMEAASLLSELYEPTNTKESLRYLKIADAYKDSLFGTGSLQSVQTLVAHEEERQKEIESTKAAYQNKLKQYVLTAGLVILVLVAFFLFRNNRKERKAKKQLQDKNTVIEQTLNDLKSTQSQLIQSEKMASLGELTAGIAHEIQNPLNFVNNFSEVNKELVVEMKDEMDKGNLAAAKEIANDVIANEEKINHHGKRADAIVKGMLQHSSSGSGKKELTNINALADEYLRLAYHGLRAKDKSFNATMKTDFDETIGNINIIPQDIGRVILNLITNAFYAASLPSKGGFSDSDKSYNPSVWVSTKKVGNQVLISVRDNGPGIPQKILDKIFQPFFTTKPTGQGTGLGLSLSYDIVKAHGGEIKVNTKENEGTEFTITLPA